MLLDPIRERRHIQYRNVARECRISEDDRRDELRRLRQVSLTGSETLDQARYNRLREHVLDSTADLFVPDAVRFGVVHPPHYGDRWNDEAEAARDEIQRMFTDTDSSLEFGLGVEWGYTFPTVVFKVFMDRGEPTFQMVDDPSDIGVLRESQRSWDRQEAITHTYEVSLHEFRRLIAVLPNEERRKALMTEAEQYAGPSEAGATRVLGPAMSRLIIATATPTMNGTATMVTNAVAEPRESEPVVKLTELWVWDDEALELCKECGEPEGDFCHIESLSRTGLYKHKFQPGGGWEADYRVVTIAAFSPQEDILLERLNPLDPGFHCFHPLTLEPVTGYIWGLSQINQLFPLQMWRESRMNGIDNLLEKQVNPPIIALGIQGTADEKLTRLKRPGGVAAFPPGGQMDVKPFLVPMPADAFAEVHEIDSMFDRQSGKRGRQMAGGSRSGDQVSMESMLAGGPTLTKAMRVESCLSGLMTALLRIKRRTSKQTLTKIDRATNKPEQFWLAQMPGDFTVRVAAHSASPMFQQQILGKVAFAAQQKWLDPDEGIVMLNLPFPEILGPRARKRAEAQAEASKEGMGIKKMEAESKALRAVTQAAKDSRETPKAG